MNKLLRLLGFGKPITKTLKPSQTVVFSKYNLVTDEVLKEIKSDKLRPVFNHNVQIPQQFSTPEFRSYMSKSAYKRKEYAKIKKEQLAELVKKQKEKARIELFDNHEKAVSQIMYMNPQESSKEALAEQINKLTDADICLQLLDYDGYRVLNTNKQMFMAHTNNILLDKIARSGKSTTRADMLIDRLTYQLPKDSETTLETAELVNAILLTGNEKHFKSLFNIMKKNADTKDFYNNDLYIEYFEGIIKASKSIKIPEEFSQIPQIILDKPVNAMTTAKAKAALECIKDKQVYL